MAFLIVAKDNFGTDHYLSESESGWTTDMSNAFQTNDWSKVEAIFDEYEKDIVKHETSNCKLGPHLDQVFPMGGKLMVVESILKTVKTRSVGR
ncbi:MAG: hypothetical protein P4L77_11870 [Sulfuriferula sp.]|nr:hypothetical protein [Sulfuriferula sp.]